GTHTINMQVITAAGLPSSVNLASGFNAIPVPSGITGGVIIKPPSTNAQTLILKGVTGDTGAPMSKVQPFLYTFDTSPPANVNITAGGTVNNVELIWF